MTLDANVLIYAVNEDAGEHERAVRLVERLGRGPDLVYVFWPTVMAFLRIVTHPAIMPRPLSPRTATETIGSLLVAPHVRSPGEAEGFWDLYRSTGGDRAHGNDVPDTHLVALMRQHGVRLIYTRDRDFRRYPEIDVRDPFAQERDSSRSQRPGDLT